MTVVQPLTALLTASIIPSYCCKVSALLWNQSLRLHEAISWVLRCVRQRLTGIRDNCRTAAELITLDKLSPPEVRAKAGRPGRSMGIAALASCLMGKSVNKALQTSDFVQRPLTAAQLHYAALDAAICLAIFSEILKLAQPKVQRKLISAPWG